MRYLLALVCCFALTSCNYFNVKKTSSEAILEEELQTFNWNEVDEYPTFSSCDSISEKNAKKNCFERTLTSFVLEHLSKEKLVVSKALNDTVYIDFKLSENGEISIINIQTNQKIQQEIPKLQEYIRKSMDSLPTIYPAIKRGQQVMSQFRLPVIIKSD